MSATPLLDKFSAIRCMIFDMDGVLTDGTLLLMGKGIWARSMHIKDGYALQAAVKANFVVAVISGSGSDEVADRLTTLGITMFKQYVTSKASEINELVTRFNLKKHEVLYMGDDLPDREAFECVGLSVCPQDAAPEIRSQSDYISPIPGGKGCVRDVIEKVMRSQNKWDLQTAIQSI